MGEEEEEEEEGEWAEDITERKREFENGVRRKGRSEIGGNGGAKGTGFVKPRRGPREELKI